MSARMVQRLAVIAGALGNALRLAPSSWDLRTSQRLIAGVKARTSDVQPLDLLSDLYDSQSALCSEGVWHNAWFGTAQVLAARQLRLGGSREEAYDLLDSAVDLADSLYDLNFDDGFRRRTESGIWRTADASASIFEAAGESASFYAPSRERRSIQNAAAVIFHSLLAEEAKACGSGDASRMSVRSDEVGNTFLKTFYDHANGRFRRSAAEDGPAGDYWRAVDQAVGCLACLRLARLDPRWCNTDTELAREAAWSAVGALLDDFGYDAYANSGIPPLNHLGNYPGTRRRNSWHDALVCFTLAVCAESADDNDFVSASDVAGLLRAMLADYKTPEGLLMHQKQMIESELPVQFSCTQAIWGALGRAADEVLLTSDEAARTAEGEHRDAWRAFHTKYADAGGLLPVANVYPATRLWCNTEPAAWLLMERSDFAPERPKPIFSFFNVLGRCD